MSICFSADCNHRCLRERCKFLRFPFITPLVESYEQLSRCPTSGHFLLALKAYYRLQTVLLLCNKRSTSMTGPFSIVATKVRDFVCSQLMLTSGCVTSPLLQSIGVGSTQWRIQEFRKGGPKGE